MSPSVNLPFTLSFVLLLLCLHLIKLIFLLLCLVHLKIHHRHQLLRCIVAVKRHRPLGDCLLVPTPRPPSAPTVEPSIIESDLRIAIRKGIRSTRNPSPHYTTLSYHRLSQPFYTCLSSISSISIPKFIGDDLAHPGWR